MGTLKNAKTRSVGDGVKLLRRGEVPTCVYLILQGAVEVVGWDEEKNEHKSVCILEAGELIGELEFFSQHPCVADCFSKVLFRHGVSPPDLHLLICIAIIFTCQL